MTIVVHIVTLCMVLPSMSDEDGQHEYFLGVKKCD